MKYKIGDKVELNNGNIVEITNIHRNLSDEVYLAGGIPIPEERIVKKVEN